MYLLLHCSFILLLSFVPGIFAQSVTVDPATAKLDDDALITFIFTPEAGDDLLFLSWFKSDADGVTQGNNIISNITGNTVNGRYSLNSEGGLIISNVEVEDEGYYLCRVTTVLGNFVNGFSTLTVNYLETPVLAPTNISVNETKTATFTCPLPDGVPTPITITWIKDDSVLDVSDTKKYPQSDTTLEISKVDEKDEGDYRCRAENAAYSGNEGKLSNTGTLSVLPNGDGLSTGAIVGIVIGCLVGLGIIGGIIYYCYYAKMLCFSGKT